jgi:AraC family transcriptional regulator, regulatory protein of adaptative response / methylphosphotriester-DNA alkyltransferase methyltransferase
MWLRRQASARQSGAWGRAASSLSAARGVQEVMPIQRPSTVRHRTALFEDAVAIVEAEYATELSLDDIARRVASSRRQLQRAYSEIGQTTFREHLTGVRMDRAAELLSARGLTVREVAGRVGYRQPAQFAKAFRRHHGASPSDFRATRRQARDGASRDGAGRDGATVLGGAGRFGTPGTGFVPARPGLAASR